VVRPTVGSLFSGIGGMDKGLHDAGWELKWQVEIDEYRRRVLSRHWPEVPKYDDITTVDPQELERVDLICGGFPCQDISVAGKRAGLAGDRSSLFWEFIRIADALRPRWLLIENVPGLFSSRSGRDFRAIIGALDERGYGVAWRVLDSQFFGVPQRRRRVYIVGHLGAPCPPEILFESESLRGNTAARGEAGADIAPALRRRADSSGRDGQDIGYALTGHHPRDSHEDNYVVGPLMANRGTERKHGDGGISALDQYFAGHIIPTGDQEATYVISNAQGDPNWDRERSFALDTKQPPAITGTVTGAEAHNDNSSPIAENYVVNARQNPIVGKPTLDTHGYSHAIAVRTAQRGANGIGVTEDGTTHTLDGTGGEAVAYRKRTMEHGKGVGDETWERTERANVLTVDQRPTVAITGTPADPDGVRAIARTARRVDSDGRRYAGLGDAVTAPVARWIGERIIGNIEPVL